MKGKYIVYISRDYVNEDYVHTCEDYFKAIQEVMFYLGGESLHYGWEDETLKEMLRELANGAVDLRNDSVIYVIEWDGVTDPVEVAQRHEASLHLP